MTIECPSCRKPTEPEKESEGHGFVFRIVRCARCRKRWESVEKVSQELPWDDLQLTTLNPGQTDVIAPPERQIVGGGGGSGSDLTVRSGGQVLPVLGQTAPKTLARARVGRGARGQNFAYPAEFEEILAGCDGWRGHKGAAYDAWVKQGQPGQNVICPTYVKWKGADQWRRGFEPHLSTWFNARGWEKEPNADELAGRPDPGGGPIAPPEARREAFRAQSILDGRIARVKRDLAPRRGPAQGNPVTDLVAHLAGQKGVPE